MGLSDAAVLILEEKADELWRIEQYLLEKGHAVLAASSQEQALEHLASGAVIDLLLVDEQIAGPLSDDELLRVCLPSRPRMRVLVLSSSRERSLANDRPYPLLLKPVRLEELGEAIDCALRRPPLAPWHEC